MAPETLPIDPKAMIAAEKRGHAIALGLAYVDHGADWCALALDYDRRLSSDVSTGILASGPIVSLMDSACGFAVWLKRGVPGNQATLDLRLDYLRPARVSARVFGRAECYRLTRRIAFVRGIAHDGDVDDPIAHATGTFILHPAAA